MVVQGKDIGVKVPRKSVRHVQERDEIEELMNAL
jgi:hypothetical protein